MRKIMCKVDGETFAKWVYSGCVIEGDLDLSDMDLEELPDLSDVTVTGSFNCANNHLRSLNGAPQKVGWNFDCRGNILDSLDCVPRTVDGSFNCSYNRLKSLTGAPQRVGHHFDCSHNYLSDLMGAPQHVGGSFDCSHNHLLKSLKGAPQFVGEHFICRGAVPLTPKSENDLPQKIRGRCDVDVLKQDTEECDDDVLGMECDDDVLEMECAEIAEKILADFKQKQPELFVSTKKEKMKKDTAENNSVSLAIKTKKKILGRARQKSK